MNGDALNPVVLISVLAAASVAAVAGWLVRGLVERAKASVAEERIARLTEQLAAERSAAEARSEAPHQVADAMAPVHVALTRLETAVARAESGRAASTAQLAEQLRAVSEATLTSTDSLRRQTARLVGALSHSEVRGRWGEVQLRRLLEGSGLIAGLHFTEQFTVSTDHGRLRPDVILHLGADKSVVVDAKVSLRALLGVQPDDPDDELAAARAAHAREVRAHVERLAGKDYARQFDSAPEFVVMFLPAESLLAEALAEDPALLEFAFDRGVVLTTPTTLMALLRTVGHIWRQDAVAANARQIQALGRELAERLATMLGHLAKLGTALGSGVSAYNRAIASLESRVLVTGRRFTELQELDLGLDAPAQVDVAPRTPAGVSDRPASQGEDPPVRATWSPPGAPAQHIAESEVCAS